MIERIKPFSRYIAGLGAVALVAAVALFALRGMRLDLPAEVLLALGILGLAAFVVLEPDAVRRALTGRTARYGSNAVLYSVALLAFLTLVNFLAGRHPQRADLTAGGQYSLSPQTVRILKELQTPVQVTAYMTGMYFDRREAEDLLKEYSVRGGERFSYEVIDPELKPALARQAGITRDGTLVFTAGERRQDVFTVSEQEFTSAILKVSSEEQKTVYFLIGHGERDPEDFSQQGFSQAKRGLEQDNYQVATLNLAITDTIPADIAALVIADPQKPLIEDEKKRLQSYLVKGGRALILQDPLNDAGLNELLEPYFVKFENDVVIDPAASLLGDPASPAVSRYRFSQITQDLPLTFFPRARSISQIGEPPTGGGVTLTPLVETSPQSWGETDLQSRQVRFDPGADLQGPRTLAYAVESPAALGSEEAKTARSTKTRLVVVGDSDFASNALIGSLGNGDLFLNAVNWVAEEESLISIRPKPREQRTVNLTGQSANLIFLSTVVFLPLAVLAVGFSVWWQRR